MTAKQDIHPQPVAWLRSLGEKERPKAIEKQKKKKKHEEATLMNVASKPARLVVVPLAFLFIFD
ncbi:hypothetical protein ZHAS_00014596 [Anopheles sinensis]|uniref:Uncharacterized protein n=1 Tax=Anopheles sinensis TaxID=74873 RepID=A0A084W8L6_ANOSI|nr:hypothetical protein ZHAS_00014596 [Anopheles sinensis]